VTARGEIWWSRTDDEWPLVLLSGAGEGELRAVQIVAPATEEQKRGFVVLSPEQVTADVDPTAAGGVGIEVPITLGEARTGVVRVALPREDRIFCTWQLTVAPDDLVERAGVLPAETMRQLELALQLAGVE
jgi:mRNA interferase MazF